MVVKSDWKTRDMPFETAEFVLKMKFSDDEMQHIRNGLCPAEMEDKWFIYFDNGRLYFHRSWTGSCIYIADLTEPGKVKVTVNRDPEQYRETSIKRDKVNFAALLNMLLHKHENNRELMKKYIKIKR